MDTNSAAETFRKRHLKKAVEVVGWLLAVLIFALAAHNVLA